MTPRAFGFNEVLRRRYAFAKKGPSFISDSPLTWFSASYHTTNVSTISCINRTCSAPNPFRADSTARRVPAGGTASGAFAEAGAEVNRGMDSGGNAAPSNRTPFRNRTYIHPPLPWYARLPFECTYHISLRPQKEE